MREIFPRATFNILIAPPAIAPLVAPTNIRWREQKKSSRIIDRRGRLSH
jgi:hypothetical protein